jgi:hypothetical protein
MSTFAFSRHALSRRSSVIAPDDCQSNVKFYKYPTGGSATKTLSGFQYPVGALVSLAPK